MLSSILEGQSTQWRVARLSLLSAAFAVLTAALSARSSSRRLITTLSGIAMSNAGFQLRIALQAAAPRTPGGLAWLRWLAAGLLVAGAVVVGSGLALFYLRGAAP
jgi:hypothetical protein